MSVYIVEVIAAGRCYSLPINLNGNQWHLDASRNLDRKTCGKNSNVQDILDTDFS